MTTNLSRKDFLKLAGMSAAALPAVHMVGSSGDFNFFESKEKFGGFTIRKAADAKPWPFETNGDYERFDQYNNAFGQATWNEEYMARRDAEGSQGENAAKKMAAGVPGWNRFELELSNAVWWLARNRGANSYGWVEEVNELPKVGDEGYSVADMTNYVKKATLFFGASDVGVIEAHENFFYKSIGRSPDDSKPQNIKNVAHPINNDEAPEIVIPESMNRVIVFTIEMDYDAFAAGGVNRVNSAAAGQGYTKMALVAPSLAMFIRSLGYQAIPMGNDTGLSVPMAIAAGLGEDSRMGLLVTPKYGPRVRLAKVLTDMPLDVDSPISFGVKEFCEVCGKCAEGCPSGCIPGPEELPTTRFERYDTNNTKGVKKWQVRQKECHIYWNTSGVGCGNCLATCPFNKPEGWLHDATRILIGAKAGTLDSVMKKLDDLSGYASGYNEDVDENLIDYFWHDKEEYIHRKA